MLAHFKYFQRYSILNLMNLHENYSRLKKEAYAGISQKRDSKLWVRKLELAPLFLGSRDRGRLLLGVNAGMRLLDDIADGDNQPPPEISRVEYLEEKQAFIRNPETPNDNLDYLFKYCYQLAGSIGIDIHEELDAFFTYFIFDAKRLGTGTMFDRAELDQAYDACDIKGTIRGALMVFGDDPDKEELLFPLGKAVRKYYTLRDYEEDIAAGFVNIPKEDMVRHGITQDDLPNRYNPRVKAWFQEEALTGLQLLEKHKEVMRTEEFRLRGRLVLPFLYAKPAKSYFQKILANQNHIRQVYNTE